MLIQFSNTNNVGYSQKLFRIQNLQVYIHIAIFYQSMYQIHQKNINFI